jgi:hypothetical protein
LVKLPPSAGRDPYRPRAKLRERQVEGVDGMAPEKEGSGVKGNALKEILYVDRGTTGRAIRNKI